mgnify:CR=1 FL=1
MIKVSVVGAKGRMGSHVVEAVNNAEDTQLALAWCAGVYWILTLCQC